MNQDAPWRRETALDALCDWIMERALEGAGAESVLGAMCERLAAIGVPLMRSHVTLRAYHPQFDGVGYVWSLGRDVGVTYHPHTEVPPRSWLESPFYHLTQSESRDMRVRLDEAERPARFPVLDDLRAEGATDYYVVKVPFFETGSSLVFDPYASQDGLLMSFVSKADGGFGDADIAALQKVLPVYALFMKATSTRQTATDLLATYLGADAGNRVLSGDLQRGSAESIRAVILYFDLQGFTRLSETLPGSSIISMLNAYFGPVVERIEAADGNVLKFMGDGLLAIFPMDESERAALDALEAVRDIEGIVAEVSAERAAEGLPHTGFSAALHAGDVLYGNIGASRRLDFTVIGPAVNAAARMLGMCANLDQRIVISARVAAPALAHRADLVSLGQYRLRGVAERQELYTLD